MSIFLKFFGGEQIVSDIVNYLLLNRTGVWQAQRLLRTQLLLVCHQSA